MASKRRHFSCTLKEKLEVLKRLDKGECATKLSREYGVGKATISDWKKNRAKIEQFCSASSEKTLEKRQKTTVSSYEKLDEALFLWFTQEREKGIPISGPLVKEKSLQLNKLMNGDPSFSASCGFLDRWKKRHGIRQLTISGEKLSADNEAAADFLKEFKDLVSSQNYTPQQVYNADETGLNFKALPTRSLASEEEKSAPGFKMDKQRLTVLACSNASGTNKLPLMVIGKSAKPRAFKNINIKSLPVYYKNSKKAWMDCDLFKGWFEHQFVPKVTAFNRENGLPNRALLFIDNAPSHPGELVCGDIKTVFLPKNVTSIIQPMDQGVLQAMKQKYRKMLLRTLLEEDEDENELTILQKLKKITIKDVIYWVAEAWDNTTKGALQKSWKNLWPTLEFVETSVTPVKDCELLPLVKKIPGCEDAEESCVEEWTSVDDNGNQEYGDEDIVAMVQGSSAEIDSEESEEEVNVQTELISHTDAANALDLALRYVEQHASSTPNDVMLMRRWRNIASSSRFSALRQKKITDFLLE